MDPKRSKKPLGFSVLGTLHSAGPENLINAEVNLSFLGHFRKMDPKKDKNPLGFSVILDVNCAFRKTLNSIRETMFCDNGKFIQNTL